ncbi:glycosyltransferase [bacterium]|nr:glycosyltransferase [bacterium]
MNPGGANIETVTVSVVIPCYNGRNTIGQTLSAVRNQKTGHAYEVIVVDSSDDGTDRFIRAEFPEVRLIHLDRQTLPGSGRNTGIREAGGEIVVFTDADAVPDPDWLERIVALHRSVNTDGVGGCVINGYPESPVAWVSHLIEFNEWTECTPAGNVQNIPSVNISFKRNTFFKYRLCFSDVFPSEDTLFNWSLTGRGGTIYFDPAVRVVHLSRVGFFKMFQHQLRLGRASAHARRISTLPGGLFVRFPFLCPVLPFVRWIRAVMRLVKTNRGLLFRFLLLTPLYLMATTAWTIGFMQRRDYPDPVVVLDGCDFTPDGPGQGGAA